MQARRRSISSEATLRGVAEGFDASTRDKSRDGRQELEDYRGLSQGAVLLRGILGCSIGKSWSKTLETEDMVFFSRVTGQRH